MPEKGAESKSGSFVQRLFRKLRFAGLWVPRSGPACIVCWSVVPTSVILGKGSHVPLGVTV